MPAALQQSEQQTSSESGPTCPLPTPRSFAIYCLSLALVPVLAVIASFFIARSAWYVHHQRNSYLAIGDYPFTLTNMNCEVVIFGDSSALTGVSPRVIETATSLRTCNIAQPSTTLSLAGNFALDFFLENNPRPRFLIFQFSASDFAARSGDGNLNEEGALQLLRHKFDLQTSWLFVRHPFQALEFSEFILRTALLERNWTTTGYASSWAQVQTSHGLFTPPGAPLNDCVAHLELRAPDPSWIRQLRREYSQQGMRVLIYAAPQPDCDSSYDYYAANLAQLADGELPRFSVHMFTGMAHFTREGADLNSRRIAEGLASILREDPSRSISTQNWK
jgi:hypothetical protein